MPDAAGNVKGIALGGKAGEAWERIFGEPPARDRCGSCGQFLRADSLYSNRCSGCWGPEDELLY